MSTSTDIGTDVQGEDAQVTLDLELGILPLLKQIFDSLAMALSANSEDEQRTLFEVVHRSIVIFDDFLCERFNFSRKPRGKYIRSKKVIDG